MSMIPFFLADTETQGLLAAWRVADPASGERLIIFKAIGAVTLLVLLWAIFLRKKRRRRREHHSAHRHSSKPAEVAQPPKDESALSTPGKHRHRRHSNRHHRTRNPTLAETGGLPPIRSEGPPEVQP
jgi:type VI protein secretion system component VasK